METLRQGGEMKELLMMGRDSAAQLQVLVQDLEPGPALELVGKIVRSFDTVLSIVLGPPPSSPTDSGEVCQIPATASSGDRSCVDSDQNGKRPAVKDRRGGYKRRRTSDTWIRISTTMEDGYAWRKYGQKAILNADHPRCYYRCTHKLDQGCLAIKQVQVIAEEPQKYQSTYFGHHTCTDVTIKHSNFILDSNPMDPHLISFESKNMSPSIEQSSNPTCIEKFTPPVKEQIKEETVSNPTDDLGWLFWPDNLMTYDGGVIPELCSSGGSTSSYGDLGMEFLTECVDFDKAFHVDEA